MIVKIPNIAKLPIFYAMSVLYIILISCHIKINNNDYSGYVFSGLYMAVFLMSQVNFKIDIQKDLQKVVILMVLVYAYGLILGVINGNPPENIVRNFAGMLVYLIAIPLSNSRITESIIFKILMMISVITPVITIILWINANIFHIADFSEIPIFKNYVGNILFTTRETMYIAYTVCLYNILNDRRKIKLWHLIVLVLEFTAVFFCENSKGDRLGIIVLTLIIFIVFIRKAKGRKVLIASVIGIFALIIYYALGHPLLIREIFSRESSGNITRNLEIDYFLNGNMEIFGYGLGASLGFLGTVDYNYGTEVIFLNIFHKFGLFALLIIYSYYLTMKRAVQCLYHSRDDQIDVIPLACMGYLFPSLGNPMLFSVDLVLLHIIALWIIDNRRKENGWTIRRIL